MLIAIDFDGILHDSWKLFTIIAKEHGMDVIPKEALIHSNKDEDAKGWPEMAHTWSAPFETLSKEETFEVFRLAGSPEYLDRSVVYPGASEAINNLTQFEYCKIAYVTDRDPTTLALIAEWLDKYSLITERVEQLVVTKDKREWLLKNRPDIVIDDRPRTILLAGHWGAKVFSIDQPWNTNLKGEVPNLYMYPNWDQLGEELSNQVGGNNYRYKKMKEREPLAGSNFAGSNSATRG